MQDYCFRCNGLTPNHSQRGPGRTTYHCSVCGSQTDADYDDDYGDEADFEPTGSCDNCGTNLYADDADDLCGQCEWFAAQNMNPRGDDQ